MSMDNKENKVTIEFTYPTNVIRKGDKILTPAIIYHDTIKNKFIGYSDVYEAKLDKPGGRKVCLFRKRFTVAISEGGDLIVFLMRKYNDIIEDILPLVYSKYSWIVEYYAAAGIPYEAGSIKVTVSEEEKSDKIFTFKEIRTALQGVTKEPIIGCRGKEDVFPLSMAEMNRETMKRR